MRRVVAACGEALRTLGVTSAAPAPVDLGAREALAA
jgi:2-aminoethylphosphonate-pyruvate transaminase